jgi:4-oxalocrotonate tautomerase family enzyme
MPVVIIRMRKGFSREQKRTIIKEFTGTLVKTLGVDPDLVTISMNLKISGRQENSGVTDRFLSPHLLQTTSLPAELIRYREIFNT